MKNSTLLFRSLAIIAIIAGGAHWMTLASQKAQRGIDPTDGAKVDRPASNDATYNEETDYIIGNWKVAYDTKDFKGALVYEIKKEDGVFNAYTHSYEDENGYSEKAGRSKTLTLTSFDGYRGKGVYEIEYEKQNYQVECTIDMVDENTFYLSYEYYGHGDMETWKRQRP